MTYRLFITNDTCVPFTSIVRAYIYIEKNKLNNNWVLLKYYSESSHVRCFSPYIVNETKSTLVETEHDALRLVGSLL